MAGLMVTGQVTDDEAVRHPLHEGGPGRGLPPGKQDHRRLGPLRTTPGKVAVWAVVVIVLACALAALIATVSGDVSSGFTAIGNHDAPLVEQSTGLYFSVNDMDAQVANVLLTGDDAALAADRQQDLNIYTQDLRRAEQDLQQVAVTAADDPVAQHAVGSVLDALGRYETLAADAVLMNQRGHDQAGRPSAATLNYFQQATDLMRTSVLPAATSLTNSDANSLDAGYQQNRSSALDGRLLVLMLGLACAVVLIGLQTYLALRYRRLLNPALVIAMMVAAGVAIAAAAQLGAQSGHLTVAKKDAFDSIIALTQARAISYDANADESRYLVDPARAAGYQDSFLSKSQQLAAVGNVDINGYDAALATDIDAYRASNADVRFGGYLGAEFRNITFPGERAAATNALLAYQVYERDDRKLRAWYAAGHLDQAISFDIGTSQGQSNWAFGKWDAALGSVIAVNENAFTAAIKDGDNTASGWTGLIPALAAAAIAALTVAGTWRRITEYR